MGMPGIPAASGALHSRYRPELEAERYIAGLPTLAPSQTPIRIIFLIEPGLGYLFPALRRRFPEARLVALHADATFLKREASYPRADAEWAPGGESVSSFLEAQTPDREAAEVRIVEWRPALNRYGQAYLDLLSETVSFVKRIDANARTVQNFHTRWERNLQRNIALLKHVVCFNEPKPFASRPWVVCGAGPGLEDAFPSIRRLKEAVVLAASSAAPALYQAGISPDMIIACDGGPWALFHLYETLRRPQPPLIAASLVAALPSQCAVLPVLAISDGSPHQEELLARLSLPHIALPQRGTVAASAIDLALALGNGPVYIAGVGLANRDLLSHARPYALDRFQWESQTRLSPGYSQTVARVRAVEKGGAASVYEQWFKQQRQNYPQRIISLCGNSAVFDGLDAALRA
jgi:hypothetical protein